ncbi:MAG TPA: LacI family DNA-binding transcriptional regulator [bacterium]|nr:LacI family DNA-binding transcriptional regulator [bacterium]
MSSHPTIKDVAKKAGVSITTVSFVLNNRSDVVISEEVKKRVLKVARELDYHPSAMAAGLAGKRTRNLGVIFYKDDYIVSNPFYSFVIEGIVKETNEKGFNLFFSYVHSAYSGYPDLPKIIREKNVDGILLLGRVDPKMVSDIKDRRIPVVAIDNFPALKGVDTVQIDNKQGGILAVDSLFKMGHRNIGLLTTTDKRPSIEEREEGWRAGHFKNNLPINKDLLFESKELSFWGACEKMKEALKKAKKMTALFCVNDEMAAGVLRAARELGRKVPGELSVMGFDNIVMSNYTDPPLTTVSAAKEYMGKLAVSRVLEVIENKDSPARRQEVPIEVIFRDSTSKVS